MQDNKTLILKVLVGSQAHGIADANSDYDFRGVYVLPTKEILTLGFNYKGSHWLEGEKEDQTAYEIGHFLNLAVHCNPSILEVMVGPVHHQLKTFRKDGVCNFEDIDHPDGAFNWGEELQALFPYVWEPQQAFNAFTGYGLNQRKKMLDNHLERWQKYACAYLRTLVNLINLLETGKFSLKIENELLKHHIEYIKKGDASPGWIIDEADLLTACAKEHLDKYLSGEKKQFQDIAKVNDFLLEVRKEFWL